MLSVAAGRATSVADYHEKDDPFGGKGGWIGKAAVILGIEGKIIREDDFKAILEGRSPDGQHLRSARGVGKEQKPRSSFDLTFSAPKSVSVVAMWDERIFDAHDVAVAFAFSYIENQYSRVRIHENGERIDRVTGNLVAAKFDHFTSRANDPQLHSHIVLMNCSHSERGWRALSEREILLHIKEIGGEYRQELEKNIQNLGYETELDEKGIFKIKDFPEEVKDRLSKRSKEVEAKKTELYAQGYHPSAKTTRFAQQYYQPEKDRNIKSSEKFQEWKEMCGEENVPVIERIYQNALDKNLIEKIWDKKKDKNDDMENKNGKLKSDSSHGLSAKNFRSLDQFISLIEESEKDDKPLYQLFSNLQMVELAECFHNIISNDQLTEKHHQQFLNAIRDSRVEHPKFEGMVAVALENGNFDDPPFKGVQTIMDEIDTGASKYLIDYPKELVNILEKNDDGIKKPDKKIVKEEVKKDSVSENHNEKNLEKTLDSKNVKEYKPKNKNIEFDL